MIETNILLVYLSTCIIAALSPGPGMVAVLSSSINQGLAKTLPLMMGLLFGLIFMSIISTIGLGLVLASSKFIYNIITFTSAFYLCYMGLCSISFARNKVNLDSENYSFFSGVIISVLNPKTLVFFTTLFPTFISEDAPLSLQVLVLTVILVASTFSVHLLYAGIFSKLSNYYLSLSIYINWAVGGVFIALGLSSIYLIFYVS
ncbi:LysE family translocator [Marinomonas sp. 2405UD68-3]|uniref:LysE family translocator n=1 Tax=Marinomonas sp. 2405UD68-3 TaxID=3391835 RepID=UPI0039C8E587